MCALMAEHAAPRGRSRRRPAGAAAASSSSRARAGPAGTWSASAWSRSRPSSPASSTSAGPAARWARRWRTAILCSSAAPATSRRWRCSPPGAVIVIRPMLPAVHPLGTGALCLAAALTLGLAAGSLGLGPGDTPRDGFLDAEYLRHHGGLVGESLFWASASSSRTAGAHILFVFLLLAGVLLLTGASVAGVVAPRARAWPPPPSACAVPPGRLRRRRAHAARRPIPESRWRRPSPRTPSRWCAPRTWRRRRSTVRALSRPLRRGRAGRDEPEQERGQSPSRVDSSPSSEEPEARPRRGRPRARSRAHADGQPALGGHRVGRHRLPHAEAVLPEALQRRAEGGHEGHRAHRRRSSWRRSATSTWRRA